MFKRARIHPFCYDEPEPDPTPDPKPLPTPPLPFDPSKLTGDFESNSEEMVELSQKRLSELIGGVRKQFRAKNEQLTAQVDELAGKMNLTQTERDRLEDVLTQSRSEHESKLEKEQGTVATLQKQLADSRAEAEKTTKEWQGRYESALTDQVVGSACEEAGVFRPGQMRDLLDRRLKVEEKLDDTGKGTGTFNVVVATKNEEGEAVHLPVLDYLKKMDESGDHPNLFAHGLKDGMNANNAGSGGAGAAGDPPTDPTELAKWLDDPKNEASLYGEKLK